MQRTSNYRSAHPQIIPKIEYEVLDFNSYIVVEDKIRILLDDVWETVTQSNIVRYEQKYEFLHLVWCIMYTLLRVFKNPGFLNRLARSNPDDILICRQILLAVMVIQLQMVKSTITVPWVIDISPYPNESMNVGIIRQLRSGILNYVKWEVAYLISPFQVINKLFPRREHPQEYRIFINHFENMLDSFLNYPILFHPNPVMPVLVLSHYLYENKIDKLKKALDTIKKLFEVDEADINKAISLVETVHITHEGE